MERKWQSQQIKGRPEGAGYRGWGAAPRPRRRDALQARLPAVGAAVPPGPGRGGPRQLRARLPPSIEAAHSAFSIRFN